MARAAVAVVAAVIAVHYTAHAAEARARSHTRQRGSSLKSDLNLERAANRGQQLGMTRGIRASVCTQSLDAQLRLRGIPQVLCDACAHACWSFARRRRHNI